MTINFNFETMKWEGITKTQFLLWEQLYPNVDVDNELQVKMIRWLERERNNKKAHKKNWHRFIAKWLARSQEPKAYREVSNVCSM